MSKRIGITGGIGSGKTTVSERLRELGAEVIDADECSREIVNPDEKGLALLNQRYGSGILLMDGTLNRQKLAEIIFASDDERKAVEKLLHPLVIERLLDRERMYRRKCKDAPIFFEIPLLFESGMQKDMDEVWLITADEKSRVKRIVQRSGCTEQEALARIKSQMPVYEQRKFPHTELNNSGDKSELIAKVDTLYRGLFEEISDETSGEAIKEIKG